MTHPVRPFAKRAGAQRSRHPPVIGFLVDRVDDSYQNQLLGALVDATGAVGASLVCFCASPLHPASSGPERHHAFHLASVDSVDALVVSTPTLVCALGHEELTRQLARFSGIPVVSMGAEWNGVASIVLDNEQAMQSITRHLITEHRCRRTAFLRGPVANTEAQARYRGYVAALREAGIEVDTSLIVQGDFHPESGAEAVRVLLDERKVAFDSIVASNDDMAVAAIHALQARGVRVPANVKVAGFDDDVTAQYELPSLTTMRQQVSALAMEAVKLAITGLEIDVSERRHLIRTELVKRRSCGCPLEREQFSVAAPKKPEHGEQEPALIQKRPELLSDMLAAAPDLLGHDSCVKLLDGFLAGLMNKSVTAFVESWDDVLREAIQRGSDLRRFQAITTVLRRGAIPTLIRLPGMLLRAETMLHEARVLLANVIHQRATQRQLQEKRVTGKLCDVAQALIVASDTFQVAETLARHLRELRIPSCCLAVYDPRANASAQRRVRIMLLYRDGEVLPISAGEQFCLESELVSERLLRTRETRSSVVMPLCFGDRRLGIAIFEMGTRDGTVYEALRAQTSAALEAAAHGADVVEVDRERDQLIEQAARELANLRRLSPANSDELDAQLTKLESTLDALLDLRTQPKTLRAPSAPPLFAGAVLGAVDEPGS